MTELSPQLLEKFILSKQKRDVLKEVTPHTTLYNFLELFILLHSPDQSTKSLQDKFESFKKSNAPKDQLDKIDITLLLRLAEEAKEDPEKLKSVAKELNDRHLFQSFNYVNNRQAEYRDNLNESSGSPPPSSLSAEQLKGLSLQSLIDRVYANRSLSNLHPDFYTRLDISRFDLKKDFNVVEKIMLAHKDLSKVKGVKDLAAEVGKLKGHSYVQTNLWPRLPLRLKEDLMDPADSSKFFFSKEMFMALLNEKFNLDQLRQSDVPDSRKVEVLKQVIEFVKHVPPRYNPIKRGFKQQLLLVHERMGVVDREALLEYLKDPYVLLPSWTLEVFNRKVNRERTEDKEEDFRGFNHYFCPSDADLVLKCLKRLFRTETNLKAFEEFMEPIALRRVFWEVKLQKGEECPNPKDYFSDVQLDDLFNQRQLRFAESNKPRFKSGEKVEVVVSVKNVSKLMVRTFEVNTLNYVLERNNLDYETIDVSGLIPSGEFEHRYTHNPIVVHEEVFCFDNIQSCEMGVFIVDFIGEEIKSRCVIYKGQLHLVFQGAHGRSCVIRDHNGQLCKGSGTGLYIENTFFPADDLTGVISIPINVASVDREVVTLHKGFADLCRLKTKEANPLFSAVVVYNSEEFLAGNKVTLAIEPRLRMYDQVASLAFVSSLDVTVTTTNDQRVANVTNFKGLTADDSKDVLVDFIFPPKVVSVTVSVEAELKIGEKTSTQKVHLPIAINRKLDNDIYDLFFQKDGKGQVTVLVLGKNGEPRKNIIVTVNVSVAHSTSNTTFSLVSDEKGCCVVGLVENLLAVEASSGQARCVYFEPSLMFPPESYPKSVLLVEREPFSLPLNTETDDVVFYALDHTGSMREEVSRTAFNVANGHLQVKGLDQGTYLLRIGRHSISVKVVREELKSDSARLVWTKTDIFAKNDPLRVWFTACKEREDHFEFSLSSPRPSLRAHLLTYNYLPHELRAFCKNQTEVSTVARNAKPDFEVFPIKNFANTFATQKRLNDELIYVYDRGTKKTFMGNTLEKPGVLLKRAKVGETAETDQVLNKGVADEVAPKQYYPSKEGRFCDVRQDEREAYAHLAEPSNFNVDSRIRVNEFLGNPGKLTADVEVVDGVVRVSKTAVAPFAFSFLWVSDGFNSSILPVSAASHPTPLKDCSLQHSRKDGHIYAYSREVSYLRADDDKSIANIANTQIFMITSLKDLFGCYQTLAKNSGIDFKEWAFLHSWASLSPMDKLKKYDKYASHELNLFLFFKDRDFFGEVVKPFIDNKKEKEVVDWFLLERPDRCTLLFNTAFSKKLNIVEKVLLAVLAKKADPQFAQSVLNLFKFKSATNKLPVPEYKALFETLLNANSESITSVLTGAPPSAPPPGISQSMNMAQTSMANNLAPRTLGFGASGMNRRMAPESRKKECMVMDLEKEECFEQSAPRDMIYNERKDIFTKAQGTIEYKERQFFNNSWATEINDFWTDVLAHLLANDSNTNFGSKHFLKSVSTLPEFVFALSVTDLPFEKAKYVSSVANDTLVLKASSNIFLLSKEIIERKGEVMDLEVLCSQRLFDPEDPVIYDDEDPEVFFDKPVDEFVTNKVYALRVVITNSTTTQLKLNLIVEVPSGAIPTNSMDALHIKDLTIDQFRSEVVELSFYFPKVGTFQLFPASVVSNGKIVSAARKMAPLVVKAEKSLKGLKTMSDVLSNGSMDDIIDFIRSKNLLNPNIFSFAQVYWLLKNKNFYDKLVAICEEKGVYDHVVWSFSIVHGDYRRLQHFLQVQEQKAFAPSLSYVSTGLLQRDGFSIREYYPLINPRAHVLGGAKTNIINDTFKRTYQEFLSYLFQKHTPAPEDWVLLTNYLIAQDQIEKALEVSKMLPPDSLDRLSTRIQHDYQTAYLNFITGYPDFAQAKAICERYLTYPVLSVRNLFVEMVNQLAEFEESGTLREVEGQKEGELLNKDKSQRVESFSSSLEGNRIKLVSSMVGRLVLKFYRVEAEVIFSLNPFSFESKKSFSHVAPFFETTVSANDQNELAVTQFDIPSSLLEENLFIEVRSLSEKVKKSEFMTFMPFKLNCVVTKELGILKCFDQRTNKPVPKVYVKCFTKQSGVVAFYKDGYTDLRGSFDYVSLNSDKVDKIESFAILVTSPEFGSKVIIETPPKKIGNEEGQAKNLISKDWENIRQRRVENEQGMEKVSKKKQYAYLY
jgi:hypothetical protein